MPALTHNRVKNGYNGYATKVKLVTGGVSTTQPLKYNGGQQPKRDFAARYSAQVNRPNALPNTIGVRATIQRANALRSVNGGTKAGCDCLPTITRPQPVQASRRRQTYKITTSE